MAINASKKNEVHFEPVPAGNHVARCIRMTHLGTVEEEWQGKIKLMNKVVIGFELPLETKVFDPEKGEQPCYISKKYTLSLGEKATLTKDLVNWRGKAFTEEEAKAFDISKLVGLPCMLSVTHTKADNGNVYANITGIAGIPKGVQCPPQVNPSVIFSLEEFDQKVFDSLHEKTQEVIKTSLEYRKMIGDFSQDEIEETDTSEEIDNLPF